MLQSRYQVVLIDDEKDLLEGLKLNLEPDFQVQTFTDPYHAMSFLEDNPSDAVVLDYHLPGQDAFDIYMQMRMKQINQPVLFLTGETDLKVKLSGLDLGVDDFLHKPITTAELSAYLKNRIKSYKKRHPPMVKIKDLEVNLQDPHVRLEGNTIALTPKEFEILSILITNPNVVIKKMDLVKKIWANVTVEENNVDTHLSNLRKKLRGFGHHIKTIKCVGYVLRV